MKSRRFGTSEVVSVSLVIGRGWGSGCVVGRS